MTSAELKHRVKLQEWARKSRNKEQNIKYHQPSLTLSMVAFLRFGNLFCRFTLVPVLLW